MIELIIKQYFFLVRFDPDLYSMFVKELREHFQWNHLLLSTKIATNNETLNNENYLPILSHQFDFVHFTLEYRIDHDQKYYTITNALQEHGISYFEYVIEKLIAMSVPTSKIVAGFNFGGLQLDVALRNQRYLGYNEICTITTNKEWAKFFDSDASLAIMKNKDKIVNFWRHIIVFENTRSIIQRIRVAMKRELAGVMASFINTDDLHGKCEIDNEKYNDFVSPHIAITLSISEENKSIPLLNTINLMMVMALYEVEQEVKLSNGEM